MANQKVKTYRCRYNCGVDPFINVWQVNKHYQDKHPEHFGTMGSPNAAPPRVARAAKPPKPKGMRVRFPDNVLEAAKETAKSNGWKTVDDFIIKTVAEVCGLRVKAITEVIGYEFVKP